MDVTPPPPQRTRPADDPPAVTAAVAEGPSLEDRILAATRVCVAEQGLRHTTIDHIATVAGCGRASVYRVFPGGRQSLLAAMVETEVAALLVRLADDVAGAPDLPSAVAGAVHRTAVELAGHPVLQRLLVEDPGAVMPFITFDGATPLLLTAGTWGREHLSRFLDPESGEAIGEWAARIVLTHLHQPSDLLVLTDAATARHLVDTYLVPGLALSA